MANALALPHIFEIAFDALTAAVGGLVILLALRVAPALTLSAHRLALRISIIAAVLIIGAQMAEVWADFSRLSTIEDAAADVAELIAVCFVGLALHLMGRAEKVEISSLRREANVDHLTGLVSRSFFHRAAERRIELYKRNGLPLACAVLDVDNFKSYNDRYGHGSGDEALRRVGRVLRRSTRADDVVARYGGEEFVILMPGTSPGAALVRMETLRREIAATPIDLSDGETLRVDFSAGIAGTPADVEATTPKALLTCADARLLAAKRAGRGRCIGAEASSSMQHVRLTAR